MGDVSSWTVVSGSFETDAQRGSYRLYVNPARSALYQLMRYQVELRTPESPEERRRGTAERVAFIPRPGVASRCCAGSASREPSRRGTRSPRGRREYVLEMNVLMRVLGAHRAARLASPTVLACTPGASWPVRATYST